MKQIDLTNDVKALAKKYADNLFANKRSDFIFPLEGLKNLRTDLMEVNDELEDKAEYIDYLEKLIAEYNELKCLLPNKFEERKKEFDDLLHPDKLSNVIYCRSRRLPDNKEERMVLKRECRVFYEEVVARMRYADARQELAKYLMEDLAIQTCVYCNSTEAIFSDDKKEAYYHLDHWKPKDKYPFLSVCFFNLYPCCSNCNGHKLDGAKGSFQLYAEGKPAKDPFVFMVDRSQYTEMKPETLTVKFDARVSVDAEFCKEYREKYRIIELYNAPSSLRQVEKLIYDINRHRGSYPDATNSSIPGVVDRQKLFHFVLGINGDEENIFTDVKKKLKLDTAKDAKLI